MTDSRINPLLKLAVLSGAQSAVISHIRRGDNVNGKDERGRSPLLLAASRGHIETCRILWEAGADFSAVDNDGNDAAALTVSDRRGEIVQLLAAHCAMARTPNEVNGERTASGDTEQVGADEVGFDLSGWQEDENLPRPESDDECLEFAASLQREISAHLPIDKDDDWSDVAVDLPDSDDFLAQRQTLSAAEIDECRRLFLAATLLGRIPQWRITETATGIDGVPDYVLEAHLSTVLGDLGVIVDHDSWECDTPAGNEPAYEEADELEQQVVDDAIHFLATLTSQGGDFPDVYYRDAGVSAFLSHDEEIAIGKSIEAELDEAVSIIARSECAVVELLRFVENVDEPAETASDIPEDDVGIEPDAGLEFDLRKESGQLISRIKSVRATLMRARHDPCLSRPTAEHHLSVPLVILVRGQRDWVRKTCVHSTRA